MTRPLLVTADPGALDDLSRLAALAGVEAAVVPDLAEVRRQWDLAPLVVLGDDVLDRLAAARPGRRDGVVVLGRDVDDPHLWQRAVEVGAERVVMLPDDERWLVEALADAAEGRAGRGTVLAVVGGRGGAGATTFACALAQTAARRGSGTVLVDGDPLGGGVDVVFRAETAEGMRWPDLASSRGRVPAAALARALPRAGELALLSWDRGPAFDIPVEAVRSVLSAARRSHDLVVGDLPRHVDDAAREVLLAATTTFLVVPAEVRAVAAAARVAARLVDLCQDVRLVVRGPAPSGLSGGEVAGALKLPLAGELRPEPSLARSLEEGVPPGERRGSPLAALCRTLLEGVAEPPPARAA
jgi:secretion/DNA translocation related CpaE-like protein